MDSFFPSTVKQWLDLPDHIKNASISSFTCKIPLNTYFCRKSNKHFKFGTRNTLSLKNNAIISMADMYNQSLTETIMCGNCVNSLLKMLIIF